jgi:hypothetical protein
MDYEHLDPTRSRARYQEDLLMLAIVEHTRAG